MTTSAPKVAPMAIRFFMPPLPLPCALIILLSPAILAAAAIYNLELPSLTRGPGKRSYDQLRPVRASGTTNLPTSQTFRELQRGRCVIIEQ
jgi:hypothetical protein